MKERHMIFGTLDNDGFTFQYYKKVSNSGYVLMKNDQEFLAKLSIEATNKGIGEAIIGVFENGVGHYEPDLLSKWKYNNEYVLLDDTKKSESNPVPFGSKMAWYVFRALSPEFVIERLGLKMIKACDWEEGIDTIYENQNQIFVSPLIGEWIFSCRISFWGNRSGICCFIRGTTVLLYSSYS